MPDSMIWSASACTRSRLREECLVLEIHVVEMVAVPQLFEPQRHADRFQADPFAPVDERIRAERAAEIAALRGDEVQLPLALEREVALDRESGRNRARETARPARSAPGGFSRIVPSASRTVQPAQPSSDRPCGQPLDDLCEGLLTLAAHRDVDGSAPAGIRARTWTDASRPRPPAGPDVLVSPRAKSAGRRRSARR